MLRRSVCALGVSAFFAGSLAVSAGCGDDSTTATSSTSSAGGGGAGTTGSTSSSAGGGGGQGGATSGLKVRGSVEQIDVWRGTPNTKIELHDAKDTLVASGTTDKQGSFIFRKVTAGDGYSVTLPDASPVQTVSPIHVMSVENSQPDQSFYSKQKLVAGVNYITTRDGTPLSVYVTLPGPIDKGPYPTVVNYSGYNPSQPGAPVQGDTPLCPTFPALCDAPNDPSALIADLMGYATVSVNMRGTGCSGGAYDYFEELQLLDGYDVIETAAAQSWVLGNRVGMTGLSYPGITQLFVAKTKPPSLAAITPLSVIGNTYTTGRPGGIFNDGFALEWVTSVLNKADPYGQGWEQGQVDKGDKICEDNQLLHSQKVDVIQEAKDHAYYDADLMTPLNPTAFVNQIDVPVFLAGAFQDEQTGPFFFSLLDQFTSAPVKRFTIYNGVHVDGFAPQVLVEWKTFLDLYVAHKVPSVDPNLINIAPALFNTIFKQSLKLSQSRFAGYDTWEDAKAAYEKEQSLRVIYEDGYGESDGTVNVGAPEGSFEKHFDSWPVPTTTLRLFFQSDGTLGATAPAAATGASTFTLDPDAGHRGILAPGGDVWDPIPDYDWIEPAAGNYVSMVSAALEADQVMTGTGSVDLWIRSQANDADLEVNLSEVRPDGQEMFVQSGWLRASLRKEAASATELWPEHTYLQTDEQLLNAGEWVKARVGICAFSHVFRKGSKIRITVDTPGDSRAAWEFDNKTFSGTTTYDIGHSSAYPSSIALPVLAGVTSPTTIPACPSLRGQQCRKYDAYTNVPAAN